MSGGIKSCVFLWTAIVALLSFSACGGGGGGTAPPPNTYTVGGTVSRLSGTVVLQNNGGNNLPVSADGSFTFTTPVANGGGYSVTVLTQPSSPAHTCAVTNGSGTSNAKISSVQVFCSGEWTWVSGANVINQMGTYGTQGAGAPSNVPGARYGSVGWKDANGDPWLFGGYGYDSGIVPVGELNDFWKFSAGEWTWMSGSNVANTPGIYGTLGMPAPGNAPGGRHTAAASTDAAGNFWAFGGLGLAASGAADLNDLWKYSGGEWTWMSGSNLPGQVPTYGTLGTAAPGNVPGARFASASWTDAGGNFWLFGGQGRDTTGHVGFLNDLWRYSAGEWTWMSGANGIGQAGTYGTLGTAAPSNVPGARSDAVAWEDGAGNFWLFGGQTATGATFSNLNDLWKYSAGEWTWMGGANVPNQKGTYGTEGTAAANNIPGARINPVGWVDANGDFWFFGGSGLDSAGTTGQLNDLWKYSAGEWTWMSGANLASQTGIYGTQGMATPSNIPGARFLAVGWTDTSGNLWLFGGTNLNGIGTSDFNDLWKYEP